MKKKHPKIIIADDHLLFRDGLKTIIELSNIGEVVGEASNGIELIELLSTENADLIIMDIDMPKMNGIEATQKVMEQYPTMHILAVTMFSDKDYYIDMVTAGAKGFILKTSTKAEFQKAIINVMNGGNYFAKELLDDIIKNINRTKGAKSNVQDALFNSKDIEILDLMLEGLSAKEIAKQLNLATKTVSNYKTLMLEKTACKNSIDLIVYALRANAISL